MPALIKRSEIPSARGGGTQHGATQRLLPKPPSPPVGRTGMAAPPGWLRARRPHPIQHVLIHQDLALLPTLTLHRQVGGGGWRAAQAVARDAGVFSSILWLHPENDQRPVNQDPHPQLQVAARDQGRRGEGGEKAGGGAAGSEGSPGAGRGEGAVPNSLLEVDVLLLPVPQVGEVPWVRLGLAGEQRILGDVDRDVLRRGNDEGWAWGWRASVTPVGTWAGASILPNVPNVPWGTPSHRSAGLSQGARRSWGPSLHPQSSAASPWAHRLPPLSIPSTFPWSHHPQEQPRGKEQAAQTQRRGARLAAWAHSGAQDTSSSSLCR